jgi:hypothetical protein
MKQKEKQPPSPAVLLPVQQLWQLGGTKIFPRSTNNLCEKITEVQQSDPQKESPREC